MAQIAYFWIYRLTFGYYFVAVEQWLALVLKNSIHQKIEDIFYSQANLKPLRRGQGFRAIKRPLVCRLT